MFQFLIGTIKTPPLRLRDRAGTDVSIPHRYDQNAGGHGAGGAGAVVSIPHRYDQNEIDRLKSGGWISVFQFLIGTIKTARSIVSILLKFTMFQFLIGTIKTMGVMPYNYYTFQVSIPHRYDQNVGSFIRYVRSSKVSIPHRYDQNRRQHRGIGG